MATLFSDDFNRANSSTIGGNWVERSGDWSISSNRVADASFSGAILSNTSSLGTADYAVQADVYQGSIPTGVGMGLVARLQDDNNFYMGWLDGYLGDGNIAYRLYRVSGGTFTEIGTPYIAAKLADPVTLRLEVQGTAIRLFVNGTSRVTATDSTHTTEGDFGCRIFNAGTWSGHGYDNYVVTDFVSALTVNPNAIPSGELVFAPTVSGSGALTVVPNAIATAASVFAPLVRLQALPNAIASAAVVFPPTVMAKAACPPRTYADLEAMGSYLALEEFTYYDLEVNCFVASAKRFTICPRTLRYAVPVRMVRFTVEVR